MDRFKLDGHKLYWHLDRVTEWQAKGVTAPIYIEVPPVGVCNHRCIFCGIDFAQDKSARLESDALCRRLEEMGSLGVRSIMYAGEGEPFLHPDLPLYIRRTRESGIDVGITTNGSVGSRELWAEILPQLTWMKFSVDAGSPEIYGLIHGVHPRFFERTVDNIRQAVEVKAAGGFQVTLGVQFLVLEENLNDLGKAIVLFSEIGLDYLVIKPYSFHPQMVKSHDEVYTEETVGALRQVVAYHAGKTKMNLIFREGAMRHYLTRDISYRHCRALPFWGHISAKGDFYTCSVFIGDDRFRVGNIHQETMQDIFFGEKRRGSIAYAASELALANECRLNCRMARINEFLESLDNPPEHVNFI